MQEFSSIAIFVISETGDEDIALSTSLRYYVKPLEKWQVLLPVQWKLLEFAALNLWNKAK